jgi:hypothetical protein
MPRATLIPIIHADELPKCEDCGEPWCPTHKKHYADCDCIGPSNAEELGYTIVRRKGRLFAMAL